MKRKILPIVLALVMALSIVTLVMVTKNEDNRGYKVKVGDIAPNIELISPDGSKIMLHDLRGKVVMLQFTATWCPVCIDEMPHIESDIWQKHKDNKDFALYGVMYKQNKSDVVKMLDLSKVTYPLVIDPKGVAFHEFAEEGAGVTRNVIIDKDGKITYLTRLFNEEEFSGMVTKINSLLK